MQENTADYAQILIRWFQRDNIYKKLNQHNAHCDHSDSIKKGFEIWNQQQKQLGIRKDELNTLLMTESIALKPTLEFN